MPEGIGGRGTDWNGGGWSPDVGRERGYLSDHPSRVEDYEYEARSPMLEIPFPRDVSPQDQGGGFWGGLGSLAGSAWDIAKPETPWGWGSLAALIASGGLSGIAKAGTEFASTGAGLVDFWEKGKKAGVLPEWGTQAQGKYIGPPNFPRQITLADRFGEDILQTPLRAPPGYESPYDQAPQEMRERDVPSNIRATEGEGGYIGRPVSQAIQRLRDNRATTNTPIMPVNVGYGAAYRPQLPAHTPSMDLEDRLLWLKRPGSFDQGGPVVKQYQEGGDVLSPDRLTPSFVPMNKQAAEQIRDSFMKVFEAAPVGNNLEYRQKANRALYEQLMAPEQATFLLQLQEVAKIYPEVDVKLKEIMSVEEPFGGMMENVAGGYPQQGSRLPSERIMEETVSTVPGFSGVEDPAFTPGEPIQGDYYPPQMQRGGHVGRGTMAGELAPRGSLPVREAGESMYERFKRLHGDGQDYQGGGPVHHGPSSGVRRLREATLSPSMQRRIFG